MPGTQPGPSTPRTTTGTMAPTGLRARHMWCRTERRRSRRRQKRPSCWGMLATPQSTTSLSPRPHRLIRSRSVPGRGFRSMGVELAAASVTIRPSAPISLYPELGPDSPSSIMQGWSASRQPTSTRLRPPQSLLLMAPPARRHSTTIAARVPRITALSVFLAPRSTTTLAAQPNFSRTVLPTSRTSRTRATILFFDTSTAGRAALENAAGGEVRFSDSSTAGGAVIQNFFGSTTNFFGTATAGNATIVNGFQGIGTTNFNGNSTASSASILISSGSVTNFNDSSTAANATIDNTGDIESTGGQLVFGGNSKAGSAIITNGNGGQTLFFGTAGSATITNKVGGSTVFSGFFGANGTAGSASINNIGGQTQFGETSTADHATITNSNSGGTSFFNSSMAGNATITNEKNAATLFADASTADNATILNKLGGVVVFKNSSTAGNATITNDGGATTFVDNSCPGSATITAINGGFINYAQSGACPTPGPKPKIIVGQGSKIDISGLLTSGITFGSIEGLGTIFLGSKTLTVGTNDLSTVFGGVLADGGTSGGTGGSLVKVGGGTLILSGADTYTGPTNINAGILDVNGSLASTVFVNAGGTLMGNGF